MGYPDSLNTLRMWAKDINRRNGEHKMKEKDIIEGVVDSTFKHLPKTTSAADEALSSIVDIANILFAPFKMAKIFTDAKLEQFKKNLAEKVNQIPVENRKDKPDLNVVGPALEALKYTILDDDLREMFENLLTSSIDKNKNVFPGFIDVVRQLNSDEAKLLKYLSQHGDTYPLIDLRFTPKEREGFIEIFTNFTNIGYGLCQKPELISAYLIELEKFGLIKIDNGFYHLNKNELYAPLEEHPDFISLKNAVGTTPGKFSTHKKKFDITEYGKAFIQSCVAPRF